MGSLYDCLDILDCATRKQGSLFEDSWFSRAVSYMERMHIDKECFINFADCSGRMDSLPLGMLKRMGEQMNNSNLIRLSVDLNKGDSAGGTDAIWRISLKNRHPVPSNGGMEFQFFYERSETDT